MKNVGNRIAVIFSLVLITSTLGATTYSNYFHYPQYAVDNCIEGYVLVEFELVFSDIESELVSPTNIRVLESKPEGVFENAAINNASKRVYSKLQSKTISVGDNGLFVQKLNFELDSSACVTVNKALKQGRRQAAPLSLALGCIVTEDFQMTGKIEKRLISLGLELPIPSEPGANYVPFLRVGNLLFLTGQLCHWNGERMYIGKLGSDFDVEEGQKAARICGLNLISQLQVALNGNLDRVKQTIRLTGYMNSTPDFHGQSQAMNGASDLFVEVFGDSGMHTRVAVGVSSLPYNVAVEVEGVFEIDAS